MKITVKNFRQWSNQEFELPDKGIVRLSGISEAGKSSLLFAIAWALYGNNATRNVNTINQKGCEVVFEGYGLKVTRSKNPEKLICNDLVDETAQKHIDNTLGLSWECFSASSFIQQKLKGSLLSLSPADQLRFVQKLAFGADDPEVYRTKIYAYMKQQEEKLEKLNAIITSIKSQQEDLYLQLSLIVIPDIPSFPTQELNNKLNTLNECINKLRVERDKLQNIIQVLNKELQNPDRQLAAKIEFTQAELNKKQTELTILQSECCDAVLSPEEVSDIKRKLQLCSHHHIYLSKQQELKEKIKDCQFSHDTSNMDNQELINYTLESKTNLTNWLEHDVEDREIIVKELNQLKTSLNTLICPDCGAPVKLVNDALTSAKNYFNPNYEKELIRLNQNITSIDSNIKSLTEFISKMDRLIKFIESVGQPKIPKITNITDLNKAVSNFNEKLSKNDQSVFKNQTKETLISKLIKEINNLQSSIDINKTKIKKLTPDSDIVLDISENEKKLNSCQSIINIHEIEASDIQAKIKTNQQYEIIKTKVDTIDSQIQKLQLSIDLQTIESNQIQFEYQAAIRLKNISDLAATESVASILESINTNVKTYLDFLFPDQGTSIRLQNEKENKDGKKKAQFSLSIIHKGIEYNNLDEFSGGAESRVMLSFQLALSDLYNSPILMLDEAFSGTHPELKDDCLEALKEVGSRKLVLVIEHGVPDHHFDSVFNIRQQYD